MPIINITSKTLDELIKNNQNNLEIIDVREPEEYNIIHIKNSKLIPLSKITEHLNKIDWNKEVVFVCRSGNRSRLAANLFALNKNVKNLQQGIYNYYFNGQKENLEINEAMIKNYF